MKFPSRIDAMAKGLGKATNLCNRTQPVSF